MKRIAIIAVSLLLLVSVASVFAQSSGRTSGRGRARTFELIIRSNAKDVSIYINGELQSGGIPYTAELEPGNYTIELKGSQKWEDGSATVNLKGNDQVNINLKQRRATVMFMKPDPDIQVFVDGKPERQNPARLKPGSYEIMFSLGGLSATTSISVGPGDAYTITPVMTLEVE